MEDLTNPIDFQESIALQQEEPVIESSGTLVNASTGFPVQGYTVQVFFVEASSASTASPSQTLLGSGTSSENGAFSINWIDSPPVSQRLFLLQNYSKAQVVFKVWTDDDHTPVLVTDPQLWNKSTSSATKLFVNVPGEPIQPQTWSDVGQRMQTAHLDTLNDLVSQLIITPSSISIFKDWTPATRQNVAAKLEPAFLDPQATLGKMAALPSWQALRLPGGLETYQKALGPGFDNSNVADAFDILTRKVQQFPTISAVDWKIDPSLFPKGPSAAITAFQDLYIAKFPKRPIRVLSQLELGYRDYLVHQWVSMITLYSDPIPIALTADQAVQQLQNRFHQDFQTTDTGSRGVNEILIPILTEILTSPAGPTFGFGLTSAQIPARGTTSARDYLDILIKLSKASAEELTLRYRTKFTRSDSTTSTAVWENIYTLQGFFRDSFQSVVDPSATTPDILTQPIIPITMQGRAPFFLQYDEWVLQRLSIPFENYFQIREIFKMNIGAVTRKWLKDRGELEQGLYKLFYNALLLQDNLLKLFTYIDQLEYTAAISILQQVSDQLWSLLFSKQVQGADIRGEFGARRGTAIKTMDDLHNMMGAWHVQDTNDLNFSAAKEWANGQLKPLACGLVYLSTFTLPVITGQVALAIGDYPTAVLYLGRSAVFEVGKATSSNATAYRQSLGNDSIHGGFWKDFTLYHLGDLPYTVDRSKYVQYTQFVENENDPNWFHFLGPADFWVDLIPADIHAVELLFYRLQMGEAVLQWADALYSTDKASNISRARELYKGVYYLHGAIPPIDPKWDSRSRIPGSLFGANINPAKGSQLGRAQLCFTQIEAGLNFFGYADDMIPVLRYSTLKTAADSFAAGANSAETDFLNAIGQLESATIEEMKTTSMLTRANLQIQVAQQEEGAAQDQVQQATFQVAEVKAAIDAIQQEINDHDSFFGQLGDYVKGLKSIVGDLPSDEMKDVKASFLHEAGWSTANTSGALGLGAGASVVAGFGAFYVASYITFSSMADAQNSRQAELSTLKTRNLPAAEAQLDIAKRSVVVAGLNQQIAAADSDLASQLLVYADVRFLNIEFWTYLANFFQRIYRQYLNLATRFSWLAERALSYEQNLDIAIIRMDYYNRQKQGAGSAEQLKLDLASLEAQYLSSQQETIPIKYTVSLARDFPLQFALLLNTGKCIVPMTEEPLQLAYPGTYGYRAVAVTPTLSRTSVTSRISGMVSNDGFSQISNSDGSLKFSVRPPDALPISEFDVATSDAHLFGLPGGALMQFEGSGIQSSWRVEFPSAANPAGLSNLADVLLTLNIKARFSASLYQTQLRKMPTKVSKFILISSRRQDTSGLKTLQTAAAPTATLNFDLTALNLPAQEKSRKINNVVLIVIGGKSTSTIKAALAATAPTPQTIQLATQDGVAYSNSPPVTDAQSKAPKSPLNALTGLPVDQTVSLTVLKNGNPGVAFESVEDVLLGVDYTASLV
ncbi:hypothetical protein MMC30_000760 [Trapelia coarctata]|nr:hypothetical protein [Trapelia coarctata]